MNRNYHFKCPSLGGISRSVTKSDGEIYDTFIYLNPNATNKKLSRRDFDILNWSPRIKQPFIDEFYYDNY